MAEPAKAQGKLPLPCTIISGFLGSGKTTLLKHILRNTEGLRCAVLVNDMAEVNIDSALLQNARLVAAGGGEGFVELSNGCICCTLRDDFVAELTSLARSGRFDYLVIESTGIAEPMQVAEAFAVDMVESEGQAAAAAAVGGEGGGEEARAPLHELVRLDTCVTVVDAATLMDNFSSLESVRERGGTGGDEEEEERNISDLLLDGIEFAEVILLNKMDLVSPEEAARLEALLRALNPGADIVRTTNSEVPLLRVIATGRFSFDKAAKVPGWLKTLQGEIELQPETLEYNIGNFVYRSRRPFHPQRLHDFIATYARLQEPEWEEEDGHEHGEQCAHGHSYPRVHEGHYGAGTAHHHHHKQAQPSLPSLLAGPPLGPAAGAHRAPSAQAAAVNSAVAQASQAAQEAALAVQSLAGQLAQPAAAHQSAGQLQAKAAALAAAAAAASAAAAAAAAASLLACQLQDSSGALPVPAAAAAAAAAELPKQQLGALGSGGYGQVLRSKGFIWLATRPDLCGEWSQAGGILQLGLGGPWYCVLPDSEWPEEEEKRAKIRKDFQEPHGDRRQELVFIGIGLDQEALSARLDACLATDEELAAAGAGALADPFAAWPTLEQLLEDGDEEEDDLSGDSGLSEVEDEEEEEGGKFPAPAQGCVHDVTEGAAEVQALLDAMGAQLAVVSWHAPWVLPCSALKPGLDRLAAAHPGALLVLWLDVEGTAANQALALEKVMERPSSRRMSAKPVLRGEEKFPCLTAHLPPSLQPAAKFTGAGALAELEAYLADALNPAAAAAADAAATNAGTGSAKHAAAAASAPAAAAPAAAPANGTAAASQPGGSVVTLKRGAAEAKELLSAAQAAGAPLVVLWTEADNEACEALLAAAQEAAKSTAGAAVFVEASPGVSKANGLLAAALKVPALPTLHLYRGMKLSSKLEGPSEATPAALEQLLAAELPAAAAAAPAAAAATAAAPPTPAPVAAAAAAPSARTAPQQAQQAQQHAPSIYDPPAGKYAKPGATKRLEDGRLVHFFPKMPCLRCGCPWWTSDEWDARCIRCAWDCESSGYDDNSQPLPKYKAKWEGFIAHIKEGRAAPYVPKHAAGGKQ